MNAGRSGDRRSQGYHRSLTRSSRNQAGSRPEYSPAQSHERKRVAKRGSAPTLRGCSSVRARAALSRSRLGAGERNGTCEVVKRRGKIFCREMKEFNHVGTYNRGSVWEYLQSNRERRERPMQDTTAPHSSVSMENKAARRKLPGATLLRSSLGAESGDENLISSNHGTV